MKFEDYSQKFIHYYSDELMPAVRNIMNSADSSCRAADIGCGDGPLLYALTRNGYLDKISAVYAVDLSPERVKNASRIHKKIIGTVADAADIKQIKNDELDIVLSNQVIEHLPDDNGMIKEIKRILKPGGTAYISTVFKKWYGWFFYRNHYGKWTIDPTHEREYNKDEELTDKIRDAGLILISNRKSLQFFPITDFILKRIGFGQDVYEKNGFLRFLRNIKIPIPGYYNWELIIKK